MKIPLKGRVCKKRLQQLGCIAEPDDIERSYGFANRDRNYRFDIGGYLV